MNEKALRFRIGLFVVVSLALLAGMLWLFGGLPRLYSPVHRYTILFEDANGLAPGAPVRRAGVRIGQVSKVELDDESGQVRVEIEVQRQYTIRNNEQPVLRRTFLGDASIDFVALAPESSPAPTQPEPPPPAPGAAALGAPIGEPAGDDAMVAFIAQAPPAKPAMQPDKSVVPPGSTIKGTQQPDATASLTELQKAAQQFNRLAPKLDRVIADTGVAIGNWGRVGERVETMMKTGLEEKIVKTIDNANKNLERLAPFLSDENQRNMAAAVKNVKNASEGFESLTKNTDLFVRESQLTLKQLTTTIARIDSVMQNLEKLSKPLGDRGESLIRNLDESAAKLNRILADVQDLFGGKSDGTLGRLFNDPSLYNNLNDAACGIARLLPQMQHILKDVEVFADKIARHPEALGVGGAVRPGSGLK